MRRPARFEETGFTLVELMVGLTVTAVVVALVFGSFFRTQKATQGVMDEVDNRQGARAAMQLLERDLRMAGSGWGRMAVEGAYGGAPLTLYGINPGPGDAENDSISVLGGWDVSTTLSSPLASSAATSNITCVNVTGFAVNDLVVVTNGSSAHLFQVTSINTTSKYLAHATTSTFNVAGGHNNWPAGGYGNGTSVYKVGWISYRMDSTLYRRKSLIRYEVGKAPQLVCDDTRAFAVYYILDDASRTRAPSDLTTIEQIVPIIYPHVVHSGSADSLWASVQPRTF